MTTPTKKVACERCEKYLDMRQRELWCRRATIRQIAEEDLVKNYAYHSVLNSLPYPSATSTQPTDQSTASTKPASGGRNAKQSVPLAVTKRARSPAKKRALSPAKPSRSPAKRAPSPTKWAFSPAKRSPGRAKRTPAQAKRKPSPKKRTPARRRGRGNSPQIEEIAMDFIQHVAAPYFQEFGDANGPYLIEDEMEFIMNEWTKDCPTQEDWTKSGSMKLKDCEKRRETEKGDEEDVEKPREFGSRRRVIGRENYIHDGMNASLENEMSLNLGMGGNLENLNDSEDNLRIYGNGQSSHEFDSFSQDNQELPKWDNALELNRGIPGYNDNGNEYEEFMERSNLSLPESGIYGANTDSFESDIVNGEEELGFGMCRENGEGYENMESFENGYMDHPRSGTEEDFRDTSGTLGETDQCNGDTFINGETYSRSAIPSDNSMLLDFNNPNLGEEKGLIQERCGFLESIDDRRDDCNKKHDSTNFIDIGEGENPGVEKKSLSVDRDRKQRSQEGDEASHKGAASEARRKKKCALLVGGKKRHRSASRGAHKKDREGRKRRTSSGHSRRSTSKSRSGRKHAKNHRGRNKRMKSEPEDYHDDEDVYREGRYRGSDDDEGYDDEAEEEEDFENASEKHCCLLDDDDDEDVTVPEPKKGASGIKGGCKTKTEGEEISVACMRDAMGFAYFISCLQAELRVTCQRYTVTQLENFASRAWDRLKPMERRNFILGAEKAMKQANRNDPGNNKRRRV